MYGLEPLGGPWGGFLADVVRVPWADAMLVGLPSGIDPVSVASMSDNIPDAWRTVGPYLVDNAGLSVLIVGRVSPSIPFYAIAIAKALGRPSAMPTATTTGSPRPNGSAHFRSRLTKTEHRKASR